ncbi:MAG: archaemetzincin family Zn-dependent metalloprotease [Candidatus Omnitrophota bacterium]
MDDKKIYLLPMGGVEAAYLDPLKCALTEVFSVPVETLPSESLPEGTLHPRRGQYHSGRILISLSRSFPINREHQRMLGITEADLYAEGLNYIFGLADRKSGFGLISLARLRQGFYGLPPDEDLFQTRILKEAVHELGHTYGLYHCPHTACVMHFSSSLKDTDDKSTLFCPDCRLKLLKRKAPGKQNPKPA